MDYRSIVLGLGNPGTEYAETRHNAGFMVLDVVAARAGVRFRRLERRTPDGVRSFSGKVKAQVAEASLAGTPTLLVKPLTYMNLSGEVVGPLLRAGGLKPESLFVVVDDLNLPLGRIRVRPSGSSGGHNGLESIETVLCTDAYPRLRLGIGQPSSADAADYVLSRFLPEEREVLALVLERAAEVVLEWAGGASCENLMGRHNGFDANAPRE
jgi:PTH1 family peptidyl-tRNA hydrolase